MITLFSLLLKDKKRYRRLPFFIWSIIVYRAWQTIFRIYFFYLSKRKRKKKRTAYMYTVFILLIIISLFFSVSYYYYKSLKVQVFSFIYACRETKKKRSEWIDLLRFFFLFFFFFMSVWWNFLIIKNNEWL